MEKGYFYTLTITSGADAFKLPEVGVLLLDFTDRPNRTICFASPELHTQASMEEANPRVQIDVNRQLGVKAESLAKVVRAVHDRVAQKVHEFTRAEVEKVLE
jgi:hypothetical protein